MLHLDEAQAAHHMHSRINYAYDSWRTNVYDQIQMLQNKIDF